MNETSPQLPAQPAARTPVLAPPLGLLAELTHRCPLSCPYCANPIQLERAGSELPTETWLRVIDEAAALGVLQIHFSGGEPMARRDLLNLIRRARERDLYSNLITSGVLLDGAAAGRLADAGLDHVQLSFQDADVAEADRLGGYRGAQAKKLACAGHVRDAGLPLTANFVVHRQNIARLPDMLALGEGIGASRIEIAHVQYYGWGLRNRAALMPTAEQLDFSNEQVAAARERLRGRVVIDYVVPDYHAERPKACMGGWGRQVMNITPAGKVLPCHAAETLTNMRFASIRDHALGDVWASDPAFVAYRGTDWMPEPCRSCHRKEIDWGGCRCQAFALTGDAANTDPACGLSPHHHLMGEAVAASEDGELAYRRMGAN